MDSLTRALDCDLSKFTGCTYPCDEREQYLRCENVSVRINEGEILKMIYSSGVIPGVVRSGWFGLVKRVSGVRDR